MPKLRNAFVRGWFAARAERTPPETETLAEKSFQDRGYEAGMASGGRALPMLPNPESDAAALARVDVDAMLQEYEARKAARHAGVDVPIDPAAEDSQIAAEASAADPVPDPEPPPAAVDTAPAVKPRKSRWDDDEDDEPAIPAAHTRTNPGRQRRIGH